MIVERCKLSHCFYEFNSHITSISYFHHSIPSESACFSIVNIVRSCFISCANNANNLSSYFAVTFIRAKAFRSSFQKTRFNRVPSKIKSVLRSPSIASRSFDCKSDDRISIFTSRSIRENDIKCEILIDLSRALIRISIILVSHTKRGETFSRQAWSIGRLTFKTLCVFVYVCVCVRM